jgi:RNA polymerase Rpb8
MWIQRVKNSTEVCCCKTRVLTHRTDYNCTVSRLEAESRNYGMKLTLDYNCEIFPLEIGQNVVLALASSLARDPGVSQDGTVEEDRDRDVWRPDGKGRRGFEDDYDYVMYGRVYRFDPGTDDVVYVLNFYPSKLSDVPHPTSPQDCIRIVWRITHVFDRVLPSHDEHCAWGPCISFNAKVVPARKSAGLDHTRNILVG